MVDASQHSSAHSFRVGNISSIQVSAVIQEVDQTHERIFLYLLSKDTGCIFPLIPHMRLQTQAKLIERFFEVDDLSGVAGQQLLDSYGFRHSFFEFLQDRERCGPHFIEPSVAHIRLATRCLNILLKEQTVSFNDRDYALENWTHHLHNIPSNDFWYILGNIAEHGDTQSCDNTLQAMKQVDEHLSVQEVNELAPQVIAWLAQFPDVPRDLVKHWEKAHESAKDRVKKYPAIKKEKHGNWWRSKYLIS